VNDSLEETIKQKQHEFEEAEKLNAFTLENCFRPELQKFVQDVQFSSQQHWNFQSIAGFRMSETFRQ
jgi:hypothetical protein